MADVKLTEFLVKLCANTDDLLTRYLENRKAVIEAADLSPEQKAAFDSLPELGSLRLAIRNNQGGGPKGVGGGRNNQGGGGRRNNQGGGPARNNQGGGGRKPRKRKPAKKKAPVKKATAKARK